MITVDQAKALLDSRCSTLKEEKVSLINSLGRVLSEDLYASLDLPSFRQSAMDGYALNLSDSAKEGDQFLLVGEVKAGDTEFPSLKEGETLRIFTGAMVPDSANTVVIQEHVEKTEKGIIINKELAVHANVRKQGEQIRKGTLALNKGTLISPAGISFLASLGYTEIPVFKKPKVSIVLTGNELLKPGSTLMQGQIYESNSYALHAALTAAGFETVEILTVRDNYQDTFDQLRDSMERSDVLLVSGGISVGDYDFVGDALRDNGVKEVFYKVKQKPGKPLFFGEKDDKFVFALPGNPASALVCFYEYVLPGLNKLSGRGFVGLEKTQLKISSDYHKKGDRAVFFKGKFDQNEVEILEGQMSHMMHTFAVSNCFVYIEWNKNEIRKGDLVEVHILP